jgi:hypothetical protein
VAAFEAASQSELARLAHRPSTSVLMAQFRGAIRQRAAPGFHQALAGDPPLIHSISVCRYMPTLRALAGYNHGDAHGADFPKPVGWH